jgi:hypothetical protein
MLMAAVMIGIGPHRGSHTAVAIGAGEEPLGRLRVRACPSQAEKLVAWAAAWPERTWAVEGAGGLGHLLAQQLVTAGEQVLDVPPRRAARVRLLEAGDIGKNDPSDALPVTVAALRSKAPRQVRAEEYAAVLKVWAKRHRDLARACNQVACRLHAVLCELVPGGIRKEITAAHAVPAREPADQSRHPHGRDHPDPQPPQRRPHLLRQKGGRGQDPQRGTPVPQTPDQRRHLRPAAGRRPPGAEGWADQAAFDRQGHRKQVEPIEFESVELFGAAVPRRRQRGGKVQALPPSCRHAAVSC